MTFAGLKLTGAAMVALALAACSTSMVQTGGPRPPQGPGPAHPHGFLPPDNSSPWTVFSQFSF